MINDFEKQALLQIQLGPVQSLIDELVLESLVEDRSLIQPKPISTLLQNEEYIRGVLGIDIPLNESYPYSLELQQRILEEQLLLEGFFADAKKLGGDLKKGALALRYIIEDPGRIKAFMTSVYETLIKDPMNKIVEFCKKVLEIVVTKAEEYAVKGWETIKKFFSGLLKKLESVWKAVKGLSGWKGALAVVGLGAAVAFIFSEELEEVIDDLENPFDELKKLGKKAKKASKKLGKAGADLAKKKKKKEAFTPALSHMLLTEDDVVFEGLLDMLFGKGNKDAGEMGLELPKGTAAPSDGVLISPKQAKKAGIKGKSEKEAAAEKEEEGGGKEGKEGEEGEEGSKEEKEEKSLLKKILGMLKKAVVDQAGKWIKNLAADFFAGAVSGGIMTFVKGIGKVFGGVKYVAKIIGKATDKFVKKIKDPKKEMEEMEKGEDDPTDGDAKKESVSREEHLLREFIREKLLAA